MASSLYRKLANRIGAGYATAKSKHLFRDFVDATATVTIDKQAIEVRFQKRAHNPLLLAAGFDRADLRVPWWQGKKLPIKLAPLGSALEARHGPFVPVADDMPTSLFQQRDDEFQRPLCEQEFVMLHFLERAFIRAGGAAECLGSVMDSCFRPPGGPHARQAPKRLGQLEFLSHERSG
jgi:hypothetical protein